MTLIDADTFVTELLYDDEHEEHYTERMTIAESLDRYTEEGCPRKINLNVNRWQDAIALVNKESLREDLSEEVRQYLFYDLRHKLWSAETDGFNKGDAEALTLLWIHGVVTDEEFQRIDARINGETDESVDVLQDL